MRKIRVGIWLLFFALNTQSFAEEMKRFTFSEVERREFGYSIKLREEGTHPSGYTQFSALTADVQAIQNYYGVVSPDLLVGKSFKAPDEGATRAFDWLRVQIQHDFKYEPPTHEELYDVAARALAQMEVPDFSSYMGKHVAEAFLVPFGSGLSLTDQSWLNDFNALIRRYSQGKAWLEQANPEAFRNRVQGPAAYLILKNTETDKSKKVIFGPYKHPFTFSETRSDE